MPVLDDESRGKGLNGAWVESLTLSPSSDIDYLQICELTMMHNYTCIFRWQSAISGLSEEVEELQEQLQHAQRLNSELAARVRSLRAENNSLRSQQGLQMPGALPAH